MTAGTAERGARVRRSHQPAPLPPPQRKTDTEKVLQLMQRGKIHTASELMLMGTGGSELLSAFKEVPMTDSLFLRGQSILQVLSFAT